MKSKKNISLLMSMMLVLTLVLMTTGCAANQGDDGSGGSGGSGGGDALDIDSFKTIGDLIAVESENTQWGTSDNTLVYAFSMGDQYYRFKANMTQEEKDALFNVDYSNEDYQKLENDIISPLEIVERENMTDRILSQEELDKLVGKTGKELADAGWNEGYGFNASELEFWLDYGPFCYAVKFEGELSGSAEDVVDVMEAIQDLTVKSASFLSMGDATNWE